MKNLSINQSIKQVSKQASNQSITIMKAYMCCSFPCLLCQDNSDFEDDSQRLVIDTSQVPPPSPSLTSGRTTSDDVDHVTETSILIVSNGDMSIVEQDVVTSNSRRHSVSSNITDKDNMSVSDCNSNGELSLNLSSSSVTDMTLLSDGSGALKNSLSKSRKKSDLVKRENIFRAFKLCYMEGEPISFIYSFVNVIFRN